MITPDTKNWTWVLERPCPECGFDASSVSFDDVPVLLRENLRAWPRVLDDDAVRDRPDEATWSPLEYAAHVRDVFRIFGIRLALMREEDDPLFDNWDQDETAVVDRYNEQDPSVVGDELQTAGAKLAEAFDDTPRDELDRVGLRSDGSHFTVDTLARYMIHDPIHHLWDVTHGH